LKRAFFDANGRLRNGWWMLVFVLALVLVALVQIATNRTLDWLGASKGLWRQLLGVAALLGATWICTRLRKERLKSVGFDLDSRWARELGVGSLIGMGQILVATAVLWVAGGVTLALDPQRSLQALGAGLSLFVMVGIGEEVLFRGFLFQRLRDGIGLWPAQVLFACLFALAHWHNPGMTGLTKVMATLDISIGAVVLSMAYVRTRSLALPIGMHVGWNWMQGTVLGFGVSGRTAVGWLHPTLLDRPLWLTGGAFGIEASVLGVAVDVLALALLLSWKGVPSAPAHVGVPEPVALAQAG
jgi:membrane protease YdiL (CAAX protease family)